MTKQDMIEALEYTLEPLYRTIGAVAAFAVILIAALLVLYPFLRKKILR